MSIKNQKGFSLAEAMVSIAVMSVAMLAVSSLIQTQIRGEKTSKAMIQTGDLIREVSTRLSNKSLCDDFIGGQPSSVPSEPKAYGPTLTLNMAHGAVTPGASNNLYTDIIRIDNARLTNRVQNGQTIQAALELEITRLADVYGSKKIKRRFTVHFREQGAIPTIAECVGITEAISETACINLGGNYDASTSNCDLQQPNCTRIDGTWDTSNADCDMMRPSCASMGGIYHPPSTSGADDAWCDLCPVLGLGERTGGSATGRCTWGAEGVPEPPPPEYMDTQAGCEGIGGTWYPNEANGLKCSTPDSSTCQNNYGIYMGVSGAGNCLYAWPSCQIDYGFWGVTDAMDDCCNEGTPGCTSAPGVCSPGDVSTQTCCDFAGGDWDGLTCYVPPPVCPGVATDVTDQTCCESQGWTWADPTCHDPWAYCQGAGMWGSDGASCCNEGDTGCTSSSSQTSCPPPAGSEPDVSESCCVSYWGYVWDVDRCVNVWPICQLAGRWGWDDTLKNCCDESSSPDCTNIAP